jgi:hypothetical protein
MKRTTVSIIAVFVVSLGIWTAYSLTPYPPLDAGETLVVVGVVALAVGCVQWVVTRLEKKRAKHD